MAQRGDCFSPLHLLRLAADVQSSSAASMYAINFLEMLPDRVERICRAVRAQDSVAAIDAVLSLKVNARAVGGLAVERDCWAMEQCLRDGNASAAVMAAETVARSSQALQVALSRYVSRYRVTDA